ncbi:MAG TPA: LacI family DNA-binding transcriptional regulator [Ktedonobacterales bacterium]|nr:LacI family DNA-binding transcriptional regulator [Ktedonobacterales bacterium]
MVAKVTIRDIALMAGVSKTTVSRVINGKPDVDQETRERVLKLIAQHGFVPSMAATGLAGGRTGLVGVLVPSLAWPLIHQVIRGIADAVEDSPYELVLYGLSHEGERNASITHILEAKLTDGLIAIYPDGGRQNRVVPFERHRTMGYLNQLYLAGFPIVTIDDESAPLDAPWIGTDSFNGAHAAVTHLIELGHRRIAHITGPKDFLCTEERLRGYRVALEEAGIPVDPSLIVQGDFSTPSGETLAAALFALPEPPTAIFAANDESAYGVMNAAEKGGVRIPEDLALVGFDDITSSALTRPALTTVRQPFYEMGRAAIGLLTSTLDAARWPTSPAQRTVRGMAHDQHDAGIQTSKRAPIRIQLASELIVRASSGLPRDNHASA